MAEPHPVLLERLVAIRERTAELEHHFSSGDVEDPNVIRKLGLELARNRKILVIADVYEQAARDLVEARELIDSGDAEMEELARSELPDIEERLTSGETELISHLRPPDENEGSPVYVEIRAGTGGDEAALFVADMYRMYNYYVDSRGWKIRELSRNETGINGLKEVVARIEGDEVWGDLKFESGTHRVQRVPKTESQGRVHTSAVTVAILPESEETEVNIRTEDLRIDVYRSSGAGGQHVNTTDSAVRITHIPTGTVVTCQNERSQIKNRATAMKVLASRLKEKFATEAAEAHSELRKGQVGSGDRSERIRTYNFPQNRLTDHRIGLTLYKLDAIMEGDMHELINALGAAEARAALGEAIVGSTED